ncbi:MAG: DUF4388 domain-containing protein [Leptolyngbyaceae cyanobacterium]
MKITGYLSEFSLAELFQFLEQGEKSGRLVLQSPDARAFGEKIISLIWFKQGHIVAASDRSDSQGLLALIQQRGWATHQAADRIMQVCSIGQPLGLCLKAQGLLEAEQLRLLFRIQVLQQVRNLFALPNAYFQFDHQVEPSFAEMTGLIGSPTEITLAGLRVLHNWDALTDKLPDETSGIINVTGGQPKFRLNQLEWQLWEFAKGDVSIRKIAAQLNLPTLKIRQTAFRLILSGFLEEMPLIEATPSAIPDVIPTGLETAAAENTPVSASFLQNLSGFLSRIV